MAWASQLLEQAGPRAIAVRLVEAFIRFSFATIRWEVRGEEHVAPYWRNQAPLIAAYWHGRLLLMSKAWRGERPCWVLASRSRDGAFIGDVVSRFGFQVVHGSTERAGEGAKKGGTEALRRYLRILAGGGVVVIVPDGPRGPRMHAEPGVAVLLRMSQAPLMPISWSTRWRIVLKSWDRLIVPVPFSRGVFIYGEPIFFDAKTHDVETVRVAVEAALSNVAAAADAAMGHPPIEPEPPNEPEPVSAR